MIGVIDTLLAQDSDAAVQMINWISYWKSLDKGDNSLTTGEKTVLAVEDLFAEVCNGGFNQFFCNTSGRWANDVVAALSAIGETKLLPIYEEALSLYFGGRPVPKAQGQRQKKVLAAEGKPNVEDRSEKLDSLAYSFINDEQYCENWNKLLLEYIKAHRGDFQYDESVYLQWLTDDIRVRCTGDAEYSFNLKDETLHIQGPLCGEVGLPWSFLQSISLVYVGQSRVGMFSWTGPSCPFSGYAWKFKTADREVLIPFYAACDLPTATKMVTLPGFNPEGLVNPRARFDLRKVGEELACWHA